jgi:hypothetical protein
MMKRQFGKSGKKRKTKSSLARIPPLNHAKNAVMMAISLVPTIGSALSILIDKYIPENKKTRLVTFFEDLGDTLSESQVKIDVDQIYSDEFSCLFERTCRAVADTHHEVKRACYKAIFLNTLQRPQNTSFEQKELYVKLVDELTALHIVVLCALYENQSKGVVNNYKQVLHRLKEYSSDQIIFMIRDLESKGLLKTSESWPQLPGDAPSWDRPSTDNSLPHQISMTVMCRDLLSFITR